jgi:hypothetical protein
MKSRREKDGDSKLLLLERDCDADGVSGPEEPEGRVLQDEEEEDDGCISRSNCRACAIGSSPSRWIEIDMFTRLVTQGS